MLTINNIMQHNAVLDNTLLITVLLLVMFFLSGVHKLTSFEKTAQNLKNKLKFNVSDHVYTAITITVIALEILAPLLIVYHVQSGKYQQEAYISTMLLVLFTILATVLYHPPNFNNYYKSIPFWSNVTITGGLLMLANTIKN